MFQRARAATVRGAAAGYHWGTSTHQRSGPRECPSYKAWRQGNAQLMRSLRHVGVQADERDKWRCRDICGGSELRDSDANHHSQQGKRRPDQPGSVFHPRHVHVRGRFLARTRMNGLVRVGVAIWLIESTCLHPGYGDYTPAAGSGAEGLASAAAPDRHPPFLRRRPPGPPLPTAEPDLLSRSSQRDRLRRRTVALPPPLPRLPGGSCRPPRNRQVSRAGYPRLAPRSLQCRAHVRPALSRESANPAATAFHYVPASTLPRPHPLHPEPQSPGFTNRCSGIDSGPPGGDSRDRTRRDGSLSPRRPLMSMMCPFSSLVNRLTRPPDPERTRSSLTEQAPLPYARSTLNPAAAMPTSVVSRCQLSATPQLRSRPRIANTYARYVVSSIPLPVAAFIVGLQAS